MLTRGPYYTVQLAGVLFTQINNLASCLEITSGQLSSPILFSKMLTEGISESCRVQGGTRNHADGSVTLDS